jgi:heme/copper-type cytochrome/quinol oxidase subunit 2
MEQWMLNVGFISSLIIIVTCAIIELYRADKNKENLDTWIEKHPRKAIIWSVVIVALSFLLLLNGTGTVVYTSMPDNFTPQILNNTEMNFSVNLL